MYIPTLSKAAVNWNQGNAAYEPFPWSGKPPRPAAPVAEPVEVEAGVTAPPNTEGNSDLSGITSKGMAGWDDEDDSKKPAPDAGP